MPFTPSRTPCCREGAKERPPAVADGRSRPFGGCDRVRCAGTGCSRNAEWHVVCISAAKQLHRDAVRRPFAGPQVPGILSSRTPPFRSKVRCLLLALSGSEACCWKAPWGDVQVLGLGVRLRSAIGHT